MLNFQGISEMISAWMPFKFCHTMILNCVSKTIMAQNHISDISAQNMAEQTTRQTASNCAFVSRSHH